MDSKLAAHDNPPTSLKPGARGAVSALFLANGMISGFWSVLVPVVQNNVGIGESAMGLLILIGALAGFAALLASGVAISTLGSGPVAIGAGLSLAPGLLILTQASSFAAAVSCFVLLFTAMSVMDVAMNTNGAQVEVGLGKAVMSSFHGFWSLGGMIGAASGGFILAIGGQQALTVIALFACAALVLFAAPNLATKPATSQAAGKPRWRDFRLPGSLRVYAFGILALVAFTAEGSVIDWSALFLRKEIHADVTISGFAFAGFSFAMMLSRFSGDLLRQRFGTARLLQFSAILGIAGFGVVGLASAPLLVVLGFLTAGLGCANIVPLAFSAASSTQGVKPGTGITIASLFGYFGLLCAPAPLGIIGEAHGFAIVYLGFALTMVAVLVLARGARNWLGAA